MNTSRGFTLIELLVTVDLAVVLVTVGIPGMRDFLANGRLTTQSNQIVQTLNFARNQAISSAAVVRVRACTRGGTTNWGQGWIIFKAGAISANTGVDCADPTATVVAADTFRIQDPTDGTAILAVDGTDTAIVEYDFNGQGFPSSATQTAVQITDNASGFTKAICISAQGRPAVQAKGTTTATCLGGG